MASYIPNLSRDNISLYLVPVAWVVAIMPRFWAASNYRKACGKDFNALQPRDMVSQINLDQAIDSKTKGRLLRAEAAQQNGMENMGLFAGAIAAGNAAGLSPATLNGLGLAYVGLRVVYNHIYIFNDLVPPFARTATFLSSVGVCWAMCIQAGNKAKSSLI
ncbi:Uu.00g101490.m01.CDS01 [Anthostomella pinea]|uniref:Uu.00g101490.m01.CDS01 n=1 Tax=Anthostomella pinea TaxID=933095 RepID=A0AAI8YD07_9PEZI|nr:Uu.00g101490.m01.CDS01 [Anthostomella pinea]